MNNIAVHEINPGNNGIVATKNIKAGEVVLFIPDEFTMNEKMTGNTPSVKYLKEQNVLDGLINYPEKFVEVALFMLDESRNPYSKWTAFLETQP